MSCPDDPICKTCPCADEDDVCFPEERRGIELAERRRTELVSWIERELDEWTNDHDPSPEDFGPGTL